MTDPPAPRQSGPAPRFAEFDATDEMFAPFEHRFERQPGAMPGPILHALQVTMHVQNLRRTPDVGPKSRYLSRIAADLELACIEKRPRELTDRLCLDIAATALRLLEQGDGHE